MRAADSVTGYPAWATCHQLRLNVTPSGDGFHVPKGRRWWTARTRLRQRNINRAQSARISLCRQGVGGLGGQGTRRKRSKISQLFCKAAVRIFS